MTTLATTAFSTRLRTELDRSRLSQAELARRIGVSQQTVSKWLSGETQPRLKLVPRLAQALDVTAVELSASLVSTNGHRPDLSEERDWRLTALVDRLRHLTPAQLARVEAYVHGLRDASV